MKHRYVKTGHVGTLHATSRLIITYQDAGQSSAMLRLAEAYLFSPITLLPGKYLKNKSNRFRQGIKDDAVIQSFHKQAVIFTAALPGGNSWSGSFNNAGNNGNWWSSTESGANAWYRSLFYNNAQVNRNNNDKLLGFSVRCVQD